MKTVGEMIREKQKKHAEFVKTAEDLTVKAAEEGRDFTDEEKGAVDKAFSDADAILRDIERLERVQNAKAAGAKHVRTKNGPRVPGEGEGDEPGDEPGDDAGDDAGDDGEGEQHRDAPFLPRGSGGLPRQERQALLRSANVSRFAPMLRELEQGEVMGQLVRTIAACKGENIAEHVKFAKANKMHPMVIRALQSNTPGSGQEWVGTEMANDFIELLLPAQVVRRAQPTFMQLQPGVGKLTIPRLAAGGSADYVGEAQPIPYTQIGTGDMTMTPHKLGALTALTREVMRRTTPQIDRVVRDNLLEATALRADAQMLRGVGSAIRPTGIRNLAAAGNVVPANATVTVDNIIDDLDSMELILTSALIPKTRLRYFISPRTEKALRGIRNEQGLFVYREEMGRGVLNGIQYYATTQIPENLGVGANESEIILVDMAQIIVLDEIDVTVQVSNEATYINATGQLVSAFSTDQTVIKIVTSHDIDTRYPEAIVVLTGVKWGV